MPDRNEYELVHDNGDSVNAVHEIDVAQYARESVPKGYVRVATVSEDTDPS